MLMIRTSDTHSLSSVYNSEASCIIQKKKKKRVIFLKVKLQHPYPPPCVAIYKQLLNTALIWKHLNT